MTPDERDELLKDAAQLRLKAAAAKSLLSRRYNEMNEALRNSSSTFEDFQRAREVYNRQSEVFDAAIKAWKEAHERTERDDIR